jgi:uncharacterized protein (DUF1501 family)
MNIDRRGFLRLAPFVTVLPRLGRAAASPQVRRLLVLVELKGGNDGLNTVVPFADPTYARLRPRLAVPRDQVIPLDARTGLHPSLAQLKPAWDARQLAVVQGVGYPDPDLSHFRSAEIWDTGSRSDEYLESGWLARAFATSFPAGPFGNKLGTSAQLAASRAGIAVTHLSLGGFDTHANQAGVHAALLRQLGDGLAALKEALVEMGRWDDTLVATCSEFGRRPAENATGGTDHGTSSVQFVLGGRVRGGLYGAAPALDRLDSNGNLPFAVDFRSYYATFLDRWWGIDAGRVLGAEFRPLDMIQVIV